MSGSGDEPRAAPALRASDADRERVVELLREAAGEGRLDLEELAARVDAAYATRTLVQLRELTADLVADPRTATAADPDRVVVGSGPGATARIISIMGGHERRGRWRVAARCLVLCLMGGAELDFQGAELSAHETTIQVISVMGGAQLHFPSGVDVRVSRFAVMGGHDVSLDPDPPPAGAPVIHLRLLSLMGGARVRQDPPADDHDARRLRERAG